MKQASYRRSRTACLLLLILFLLSVLDKNPEIPSADEIPYLGYTQTTSVPVFWRKIRGSFLILSTQKKTFMQVMRLY